MVDNTGIRAVRLGIAAMTAAMALPQAALAAYEEQLLPGGYDPLVSVPAGAVRTGTTPAPSAAAGGGPDPRVASLPAGAATDAGGRARARGPAGARSEKRTSRPVAARQTGGAQPDGSRGQRSRTAPGLHHSGPHPRVAGMRTVGQDVPFAYALRLVCPLGWAIDNTVTRSDAAASWAVGEPWSNVLHRAAKAAGATLYVDWGGRRVLVRRAGEDPLATPGAASPATGENAAAAAVRGVGLGDKGEETPAGESPAPTNRNGAGAATPTPSGATAPARAAAAGPARADGTGTASSAAGPRAANPLVLPSINDPARVFLNATMTAGAAAAALGLDEVAFCRWNAVSPDSTLVRGRALRLAESGLEQARASVPEDGAGTSADSGQTRSPSASPAPAAGDCPGDGPAVPGTVSGPSASIAPSVLRAPAADRELSPARSAQAAPPPPQIMAFPLEPGTLIAQLSLWCDQAGYQLVWKACRDVEILSHVTYRGTFARSLSNVFRDLSAAGQAFRVTLYERNRVVEVTDS